MREETDNNDHLKVPTKAMFCVIRMTDGRLSQMSRGAERGKIVHTNRKGRTFDRVVDKGSINNRVADDEKRVRTSGITAFTSKTIA